MIFDGKQTEYTEEELKESFSNGLTIDLYDILNESAREIFQTKTALLTADVVLEKSVLECTLSMDEAEVTMENAVTEAGNRFLKSLTNLKDRIIAWFKKAGENISAFFMSGEKFIKTYKSELDKKDLSKFKVKCYTWDINKGSALVRDSINDIQGAIYDIHNMANAPASKDKESLKATIEKKKNELKSLVKDGTTIINAYRSSEKTEQTINKSQRIADVASNKTVLASMEATKKGLIAAIDSCIKDIGSLTKRLKSDDKEDRQYCNMIMSFYSEEANRMVAQVTTICSTQINLQKQRVSESLNILKAALRYNPAKGEAKETKTEKPKATEESTNVNDENGSLLESLIAKLGI